MSECLGGEGGDVFGPRRGRVFGYVLDGIDDDVLAEHGLLLEPLQQFGSFGTGYHSGQRSKLFRIDTVLEVHAGDAGGSEGLHQALLSRSSVTSDAVYEQLAFSYAQQQAIAASVY